MSLADLQALSPLLAIACASLVLLMIAAFLQSHTAPFLLTLAGNAVALALIPSAARLSPHAAGALLTMDRYALLYMALIFAASGVVTIFSFDYLEEHRLKRGEYYILLLLATLGSAVLVASTHFVTFFLGLELLTVSLYVLIAYVFRKEHSLEGALKYLILAGASSAFLLFGMALVYAELGTMEFSSLAARIAQGAGYRQMLILAGTGLMLTGVGFKLAVAPFHMWTPDVYQGAPAPVTAFIATVSKGAIVGLLLRYLTAFEVIGTGSAFVAMSVIAVASMVVGNLLALLQENVKRILAYSSIAHLGYLLVGVLAGGAYAFEAVTFYLVAYFASTLGAFGLIGFLSTREREPDTLKDFRGLSWRRPWVAAAFITMLLSLAGIPLTAGFLGKFLVFAAGVNSDLWFLVLMLALNSAIGLFYYLRIILAIYSAEPAPGHEGASPTLRERSASALAGAALAALCLAVVGLGIYPKPVIALIQTAISALLYE
jgi:NADH-quinone oxidoreductase subunit N